MLNNVSGIFTLLLPGGPLVREALDKVGVPHEYAVLAGTIPFTPGNGVTELTPPQRVKLIVDTAGLGSMKASTMKSEPMQEPEVGVTVYRT